jgi:hypothetical protein
MALSSKLSNICSRLPSHACKSVMNHRHSAVLIKNGNPVSFGFNTIKGERTYHAEHDVILKYLYQRGIKGRQKVQRILQRQGYEEDFSQYCIGRHSMEW